MQKNKNTSHNPFWRRVTAGLLLVTLMSGAAVVHADQYDDQINAINASKAQNQASLTSLISQAASYQEAVNNLQAQINGVQAAIAANVTKQNDLQAQIAAAQVQIDLKKEQVGASVKAMYIDGQASSIEEFAASKNLSEFVDKEEYRSKVQAQLTATIKEIGALQLQLQGQKQEVEQLIAAQQQQQAQLATAQAEQAALLNYTEGQKAAFSAEIKNQSAQVAQLRSQQAAENAKRFRGFTIVAGNNGNDTYPNMYRNIPQDSVVDRWGMYNRECVSYTAWKVYESGRTMPYWGGIGNANQWDDNARRMGIPVDNNPRPGDVAVAHWGYYGHVMYVDSVNANGTINISQYNYDFNGRYSEIYNFPTTGLQFIHF